MPAVSFPVALRDGLGPVVAGATLDHVRRGQRLPYHPILAEGLLRAFQARGWVSARRELGHEASFWPRLAPLVEDVWNRHAGAARPRPRIEAEIARVPAEIAETTLALAEAAGVRSFAQGLEAARAFLLADGGDRLCAIASRLAGAPVAVGAVRGLVLEAIKEGHTAGIIRARVEVASGAPLTFGLNVARDVSAAEARLRALAVDLRAWHATAPGAAAEVLADGHGAIRWFGGERAIAVVATTWIDGDELHVTRGAAGAELHRVVEFVQGASSPVPAIRGDVLDAKQARRVIEALAWTRSRLATFTATGVCERELELNNGDAVIDAALDVTLVGSAGRAWCGRLGAWPYRLATMSARDEHATVDRRIELGEPAAAVAAGLEALRSDRRADVRALVPRMIAEALAHDPTSDVSPASVASVREELAR